MISVLLFGFCRWPVANSNQEVSILEVNRGDFGLSWIFFVFTFGTSPQQGSFFYVKIMHNFKFYPKTIFKLPVSISNSNFLLNDNKATVLDNVILIILSECKYINIF